MKNIDISKFMGNLIPNTQYYGLPTGLEEFDNHCGELLPGCLYTIAGRPSSGKSSLISTMIVNQAYVYGKNILVVNLETTNKNFVSGLMSILSGVEKRHIKTGFLSEKETLAVVDASKKLPCDQIFISDIEENDVEAIIKMAKEHFSTNGEEDNPRIDIIYVDYLQLLTTKDLPYNSYTRNDELTYILKKLKQLARTLNIPIVITSQLNRNWNQRHDSPSRPQLTDLRESGSIEDVSDMVIFLHRPELDLKSGIDPEGRDIRGLASLIVAKNRMGYTNEIDMFFDQKTGKFKNQDEGFSSQVAGLSAKSSLYNPDKPAPF